MDVISCPDMAFDACLRRAPVEKGAFHMECRPGCAACCIALSISSPIPGMLDGKPAGVRCVQLTDDNLCRLYGRPERPRVCTRLRPSPEMCGDSAEEALATLAELERLTAPDPGQGSL
jgi:Fe-S-cluster containining protein